VPGGSVEDPGYELPFEKFEALVRQRVGPQFVAPENY
jgi:hypothetical protein